MKQEHDPLSGIPKGSLNDFERFPRNIINDIDNHSQLEIIANIINNIGCISALSHDYIVCVKPDTTREIHREESL